MVITRKWLPAGVLLLTATSVTANNIWLSAGLGGYKHDQLQDLYNNFQQYKSDEQITVSSVLLYGIDETGSMFFWDTDDATWSSKNFQKDLQSKVGLKAYPCFFCDNTIGNCDNLADTLNEFATDESLRQKFISSTVDEALKWGWDGYAVDFETYSNVNASGVTSFVLEWGNELVKHDKKLSIWVGAGTQYDDQKLCTSPYIESCVTMSTYVGSYSAFEFQANELLKVVPEDKAGFGLLNSYAALKVATQTAVRNFPELKNEGKDGSQHISIGKLLLKKYNGLREIFRINDLENDDVNSIALRLGKALSDDGAFDALEELNLSSSDMDKIVDYCKSHGVYGLSDWASEIPSQWRSSFYSYLH